VKSFPYLTALIPLVAGGVLLIFAVVNALFLYFAEVPKTSLEAAVPLPDRINIPVAGFNLSITLPSQPTLRIQNVPDPYYIGVNVLRAVLLLAIGLIGAKLVEIGLSEWREQKREETLRAYYEQYGYQYQQY
jgi:hypothetical protein